MFHIHQMTEKLIQANAILSNKEERYTDFAERGATLKCYSIYYIYILYTI